MSKKKYNRKSELIPLSVKNAIEKLSKENGGNRWKERFNNYLKLTGTIYYKCVVDGGCSYYTHPISKPYWRKIGIGKHPKYLQELEKARIIDIRKSGRSNTYMIALDHLVSNESETKNVNYYSSKNKSFIKNNELKKKKANDFIQIEKVLGNRILKCNRKATIDIAAYEKAKRNGHFRFDSKSNQIDISSLPDKMTYKVQAEVSGKVINGWYSFGKMKEWLKEGNLKSFYHKDRIVLANEDNYWQRRTVDIYDHTDFVINKYLSRDYNIKRDQNTRRVFHPLVSFPNKAFPFLRIDEEGIIGIDAKTSQFAILANLFKHFEKGGNSIANTFEGKRKTFIENLFQCFEETSFAETDKTEDVENYFIDVIENDFYSVNQNLLKLNNRSQAKIFCFSMLFSKETNKNEFKSRIEETYPTVVASMDAYKRQYGYQQLPINLQALEAEMFIDNIFKTLYKNKICSFTRHDSVVVKSSDANKAKSIIEDYFKSIEFKMVIKDEKYSIIENDEVKINGEEIELEEVESPNYIFYLEQINELYEKWDEDKYSLTDVDFEEIYGIVKDQLSIDKCNEIESSIVNANANYSIPINNDIKSLLIKYLIQSYNNINSYDEEDIPLVSGNS